MSADEEGVATFNQFVAENPHTEMAEQVVTFAIGIALSTEITINLVRSGATNIWLKAWLQCGHKAFSRRALTINQSPLPQVVVLLPIKLNQIAGRNNAIKIYAPIWSQSKFQNYRSSNTFWSRICVYKEDTKPFQTKESWRQIVLS